MSTVISSDKHYKKLAIIIRNTFGTTIGYKPSEMASCISNMKNIANVYNSIENGAIYNGETANLQGTKMFPGIFSHSNIKSFEVPESITEIPEYAFCESKLENIILHDNITSLGDECFYYCADLKSIKLPGNLISIGSQAFSLTDIKDKLIIPSSVTSISYMAFSYSEFTHIDIPSGVSVIDSYLFSGCNYLEAVILRRTSSICTLPDANSFKGSLIEDGTGYIYVPSALVDSYKAADNWSTYAAQFRAIEDYPDICG